MKNVAVFASGTGTNAINLYETFSKGNKIRVSVLFADRENAPVIGKFKELGIETLYFPRQVWRKEPERIVEELKKRDIDLIALAGFLSIVGAPILKAYPDRVLNIHPSLLPAFGGEGMWGQNVHEAVIKAGVDRSGATVHFVTEDVDRGPILMQEEIDIEPGETAESLEAKVHQAEYRLFPRAVVEALRLLDGKGPAQPAAAEPVDNQDKVTDGDGAKAPYSVSPVNSAPGVGSGAEADNSWRDYFNSPAGKEMNSGEEGSPQSAGSDNPYYGNGIKATQGRLMELNGEPMPPTYFVWSILCVLLCCFIPGLVAAYFSSRVSSRYYQGDLEGAKKASDMAQVWIIVSFVLGVLSATLYLPFMILAGMA